ncbi:uncharacterized protein BDR25DRAFT_355131 [Lindgomyces ingoldianus]|uniref:Uncharacterized protein n=1 Tax=Lindgomyces ingoldianus TaxID=673940 RepID=A0ACB6QVW4_9PLEO|nr:uncharacterized protein BDR25DRAFT_355131 [Lindgomyces ingoldianus]KAF2470650.1 hypothetical protein BDR25DRAFT_355131 [Lindgomyces ingoldianus]
MSAERNLNLLPSSPPMAHALLRIGLFYVFILVSYIWRTKVSRHLEVRSQLYPKERAIRDIAIPRLKYYDQDTISRSERNACQNMASLPFLHMYILGLAFIFFFLLLNIEVLLRKRKSALGHDSFQNSNAPILQPGDYSLLPPPKLSLGKVSTFYFRYRAQLVSSNKSSTVQGLSIHHQLMKSILRMRLLKWLDGRVEYKWLQEQISISVYSTYSRKIMYSNDHFISARLVLSWTIGVPATFKHEETRSSLNTNPLSSRGADSLSCNFNDTIWRKFAIQFALFRTYPAIFIGPIIENQLNTPQRTTSRNES